MAFVSSYDDALRAYKDMLARRAAEYLKREPERLKQAARRARRAAREAAYEPVTTVPDDLRWKLGIGSWGSRNGGGSSRNIFYSFGKVYKKVLEVATGKVEYYRLIDDGGGARPADKIDAEPAEPDVQIRYRAGAKCWFVDSAARWFLCDVVARGEPNTITLRSVTGWDAERQATWPYDGDLTFDTMKGAHGGVGLFKRLRPLKARKV